MAVSGYSSYRARGIAARNSRSVKRHTGVDQLMPGWQAELEAIGWPVDRLIEHLNTSRHRAAPVVPGLTDFEIHRLAANVLDADGPLLVNHKVFSRTNLIAELAPRLYGRDPAELDHVVDRVLATVDVVPLLGVAGAREQAYTTAEVLAAEHSIAQSVASLAEQPGARIPYRRVAAAVATKEHGIGLALSAGQRDAVRAICSSGRSVDVIVGVAGSGKTTALDAATDALGAAGYRVLGSATSGQAARTLGTETGIEARTLTSLLWRLEHNRDVLDANTVVIVDEAGMTNDRDLSRLALGVQRAGAKLVLVGDHRQLDAIGPGGALHALLERRSELVTTLDENVRQRDPAERTALAQLRDGSVPDAVAWYAQHDRIHTAPTRTDTLVAMADAWTNDLQAGHRTALLAWRRDDVTDLNRLARHQYDQAGRLTGPDLVAPGGRRYAAGDRVVALAPNPRAWIVTSQQLTVTNIDADDGALYARTADGRNIRLTGEHIDATHLDHAYALTVHRAQGANYDTAHVLAAGGGRELGYVAMSRSRHHTTIHATADDLEQAVDDLQADWGVPHHQRWITHSPTVAVGLEPEQPLQDCVARMRQQLNHLSPTAAVDPSMRQHAQLQLQQLHDDLRQLREGTGRWRATPEGDAARQRAIARDELQRARYDPQPRGGTRRGRRAEERAIGRADTLVEQAEQRWSVVGAPVARQLKNQIYGVEAQLTDMRTTDIARRLDALQQPARGHDRTPGRHRTIEGPDLGIGL
jgi:hypothetical protein